MKQTITTEEAERFERIIWARREVFRRDRHAAGFAI